MQSADVVLMDSVPYDVVGAIELANATVPNMHRNLCWAAGYNKVAFALDGDALCPFLLGHENAAILMSNDMLVVAINAQMLNRAKLEIVRQPGNDVSTRAPQAATAAPQPPWRACAVRRPGPPITFAWRATCRTGRFLSSAPR